jgi:Phosphotransferase enzyme family
MVVMALGGRALGQILACLGYRHARPAGGGADAAQLAPVLVHGDIHEDQLLADGGQLTGIIDWETARVDQPFWDFDLGEWGTGLWRRRRDFSAPRARGWLAYAQTRGLDTDSRPLETAFRLRHALRLLADPGRSRCRRHDRGAARGSVAAAPPLRQRMLAVGAAITTRRQDQPRRTRGRTGKPADLDRST